MQIYFKEGKHQAFNGEVKIKIESWNSPPTFPKIHSQSGMIDLDVSFLTLAAWSYGGVEEEVSFLQNPSS